MRFTKNEGRRVQNFGRWYIWLTNERGRLSLVSIDRIASELTAITETIKETIRESLATSADPG